ncbi:phage major capsid protein, HK97 family (plasmid) [Piscirickettsia salmonis]|uniref:Phage major capsid protein, HK97 family n=1 Tax=Piscirickettsia salmonis TaxID=1238 RepID=A0A9Q6LMV1_PISSA|nr:phage major capsid protein [Piscirickettsia salmonis]QGN96939.1 phage major capsid protein, HK97 family [Piscirickettsia salmonis]QGO07712.1 phage major capsid protein, HK97 family [Piscirickettsia salmonis]QGO36172.1 phage major capsid protein, HK97 family [Piscirickettsia salmonis]QGO39797.1 phage major capsid protein, HK97 family [Piscirickettsia salmonis]QGO43359.1 phage major capsid protein, HK97 family [Piscirickettsia salmonis]
MPDIYELAQQRAEVINKQRAMLDHAESESRGFTDEEDGQYKDLNTQQLNIKNRIAKIEEVEAQEREINSLSSEPLRAGVQSPTDNTPINPLATEEYEKNFFAYMRGQNSGVDIRAGQVEGTDNKGGYLVPTKLQTTLIEALEEQTVMRQMCRIIQTDSTTELPMADSYGAATWTGDTFKKKSIKAYKLSRMLKISDELLADSAINIGAHIAYSFGRSFGEAQEKAFLTGDGTGKPNGLLNVAPIGVTAAAPTSITLDDILDLRSSVKAAYRRKASYLMHDSTYGSLLKMKDGNGQYIIQPDFKSGEGDLLRGKRVNTSDFMDTLAAGKCAALFGDFSNFIIADRGGISLRRLNELYAETGEVGYLMWLRVDALLLETDAIKQLKTAAA